MVPTTGGNAPTGAITDGGVGSVGAVAVEVEEAGEAGEGEGGVAAAVGAADAEAVEGEGMADMVATEEEEGGEGRDAGSGWSRSARIPGGSSSGLASPGLRSEQAVSLVQANPSMGAQEGDMSTCCMYESSTPEQARTDFGRYRMRTGGTGDGQGMCWCILSISCYLH